MTSAKHVQSPSVGEPCPHEKWPILNQIQFVKTETGATEPPRPKRRNHWRERDTKRGTNQGQEPVAVPAKRAQTDWTGTQGRGHSPLTSWAFPDVSVFAPKSLKIMNVSY